MKKIRKALALLLAAVMIAGLSSCGGSDDESGTKLKIVQQYGMAYAPFKIMQEKKLIEKYYDGAEIEWSVLNSGQAINEGFASGDVDIGAMGLAPVITGVTSGVPYKICSNISAQPNRLMTNSKKVKTLKNIGKKKIALVNIGSIQHIILAMAAEKELGDAHALDHNIVAMILSRLVDTFFSRISLTMPLPPKFHNTAYVLLWEEDLHWQSRSSGCSSS